MKATELNGMRVIDIERAEFVGVVGDVMLDPSQQQITDLVLRGGLLGGGGKLVPVEAVQSIGRDAITIKRSAVARESDTAHAGAVPLSRLQGIKVLAEDGTQLGSLRDTNLDPDTRRITGYVYSHGHLGGILGQQQVLPTALVRRASPDLIVAVREAVGQRR